MTCSHLDLKQNFGGRNPGPLLTGAEERGWKGLKEEEGWKGPRRGEREGWENEVERKGQRQGDLAPKN